MKKPKIALGGAGFYIVLLLCLTVAGVSGYVMLFGHNAAEKEARAQAASAQTVPADTQVFADLDPAGPSLEILDPQTDKTPEDEELPADAPAEIPAPEVDPTPVEAVAPNLIVWPLRGAVVAAFSADALSYDETMGDWRTHAGLDLAADVGTQVMAACAGTVRAVEEDPMIGTTVVIDHPGGYCTTYATDHRRGRLHRHGGGGAGTPSALCRGKGRRRGGPSVVSEMSARGAGWERSRPAPLRRKAHLAPPRVWCYTATRSKEALRWKRARWCWRAGPSAVCSRRAFWTC